jgi:hypothetical protein
MSLCVALATTDVSEERIASIIRMQRIRELGTIANIVSNSLILPTLVMKAIFSSETSAFTRATSIHIPEDGIIHNHRRQNLKSYVLLLM